MDEWRKAARVGLVSEVQIQRAAPENGEIAPPSAGHSWIKAGEEVALQIATPGSDAPISVKGLVV